VNEFQHPVPPYSPEYVPNHVFTSMTVRLYDWWERAEDYCAICEAEIAHPGIFDWRG
jgi:hypothetical protein